MIARNRIRFAAAFIVQLHRLSSKARIRGGEPKASDATSTLMARHWNLAIRDTEKAGFIQRRADNEGLIILTAKGRAAASPA